MRRPRPIATVAAWLVCVPWSQAQGPGEQAAVSIDTVRLRSEYENAAQLAIQGRAKEAEPLLRAVWAKAAAARLPLWQARVDHSLGRMYCMTGQDSLGLALLEQAGAECRAGGAKSEALRMVTDLGWYEARAGHRVQGIERMRDAQSRCMALGDSLGAAYAMQKQASIYLNASENNKAMELFTQAAGIQERAHDPYLGWTLAQLSRTLAAMGNAQGALAAAERGVEVQEEANDPRGLAHALVQQAHVLNGQERYGEALAAAQRSLRVYEGGNAHYEACEEEGTAYLGLNRPKEALARYRTAQTMAREMGAMAAVVNLDKHVARAAAATGDHRLAYEKLQQHYDFLKKCGMLDASNDIARMELEHEFDTRHLADSLDLVRREAVAQRDHELRLARAQNTRNLLAAGAAMVLLVSLGLLLRLRHVRRTRSKLVALEKQREADQVRTRIARDMHDEIGSDLTKIGLLAAQARMPANSAVKEIADLATRLRGSVHDIVWAVDPRHDSVGSLVMHAEQYAHRMLDNNVSGHDLRFDLNGSDRPIDPARKRNIFLLLKEALNNALKYANAERLEVSLEVSDAAFDLRVSDNGIGFDPSARGREGNGLRNMRSRAEAMGARLEISAAPGRGCTVHASGPLA